jgi:GNAT superfamily N-acetyltransferase
MTTQFRKARKHDLPAIVALIADDGLGRGRDDASLPLDPAYEMAFDALDSDPSQMQMVLEVDGEIAGVMQLSFIAGLSRKGATRCQIEGVRIASSLRGRGLGRQLIQWGIDEAKRRKCNLVQLTSDKSRSEAHRFYADLGFVASHEGYKMAIQG